MGNNTATADDFIGYQWNLTISRITKIAGTSQRRNYECSPTSHGCQTLMNKDFGSLYFAFGQVFVQDY